MSDSRQPTARSRSEVMADVRRLVEQYRDRCLWFLGPQVLPETPADALRMLDYIERYGDRDAFLRSETLKPWLLHLINERSAGSSPDD